MGSVSSWRPELANKCNLVPTSILVAQQKALITTGLMHDNICEKFSQTVLFSRRYSFHPCCNFQIRFGGENCLFDVIMHKGYWLVYILNIFLHSIGGRFQLMLWMKIWRCRLLSRVNTWKVKKITKFLHVLKVPCNLPFKKLSVV